MEKKKLLRVRAPGSCPSSLKLFENLRTIMAVLVHSEQFSGKILKFFASNFECFTGIDTWRSTNPRALEVLSSGGGGG